MHTVVVDEQSSINVEQTAVVTAQTKAPIATSRQFDVPRELQPITLHPHFMSKHLWLSKWHKAGHDMQLIDGTKAYYNNLMLWSISAPQSHELRLLGLVTGSHGIQQELLLEHQKLEFCPLKNKSCDPSRRIVLGLNPTRYRHDVQHAQSLGLRCCLSSQKASDVMQHAVPVALTAQARCVKSKRQSCAKVQDSPLLPRRL